MYYPTKDYPALSTVMDESTILHKLHWESEVW